MNSTFFLGSIYSPPSSTHHSAFRPSFSSYLSSFLSAILSAIKLLPVIYPASAIQLLSIIQNACPLSLCLALSFSSRLVVLVEVVRVEEVGSSGKVNLLEKVMLVLLAVGAGAVKEGSGFLLLRQLLGRAIVKFVM